MSLDIFVISLLPPLHTRCYANELYIPVFFLKKLLKFFFLTLCILELHLHAQNICHLEYFFSLFLLFSSSLVFCSLEVGRGEIWILNMWKLWWFYRFFNEILEFLRIFFKLLPALAFHASFMGLGDGIWVHFLIIAISHHKRATSEQAFSLTESYFANIF